MYTVIYSATILDKEEWDFIMKVMKRGPYVYSNNKPKWEEPHFEDGFVWCEGDIPWYKRDLHCLVQLCRVSMRQICKNNNMWTCTEWAADEPGAVERWGSISDYQWSHD